MRRLLWIGVGVAVTVVVLRQVSRMNDTVGEAVHAVTPAGIAESISSLAASVREAGEELRRSMAEHEATLTAALLPSPEQQSRAQGTRDARARHRSADPADDPFDPFDPEHV